jgi:hypothetical protein
MHSLLDAPELRRRQFGKRRFDFQNSAHINILQSDRRQVNWAWKECIVNRGDFLMT